jgi:hypothetical protein
MSRPFGSKNKPKEKSVENKEEEQIAKPVTEVKAEVF